jgi:hypothetical protein
MPLSDTETVDQLSIALIFDYQLQVTCFALYQPSLPCTFDPAAAPL